METYWPWPAHPSGMAASVFSFGSLLLTPPVTTRSLSVFIRIAVAIPPLTSSALLPQRRDFHSGRCCYFNLTCQTTPHSSHSRMFPFGSHSTMMHMLYLLRLFFRVLVLCECGLVVWTSKSLACCEDRLLLSCPYCSSVLCGYRLFPAPLVTFISCDDRLSFPCTCCSIMLYEHM